ncbi:SubName: Full=Uncharacterized protein {ECO:0000313/EMBL:KIM32774.1} [Serendipita indica DSM 11827]|nr:SubName: Full=Uncharacterized protein {ECO:0000313/EMBL:KIM32774.1} [Serendipita indica DSM 11827]
MAAIGRVYNQAFDRSPAGTLAVTNGLLSGVADIVAQGSQIGLAYRDAKNAPEPNPLTAPPAPVSIPAYDPVRTVRFIVFGTIMGPALARWNHFLEHRFPLRVSSSNAAKGVVANVNKAVGAGSSSSQGNVSITALAKRVGMDQAIMAPFGLFVFLGSMGVMEGHSSGAIKQKYIDLYPPAIKANWTVWPVIQFVNFRFMPLPYRVPFQATCGVFWTLYLSLLNSSKPTMAKESGEDLVHDAKVAAKRLKDAEARAERAERR